ncbi:hypothetical protein V1511DRAFT_509865 [Dipodascopsis uninucleata]
MPSQQHRAVTLEDDNSSDSSRHRRQRRTASNGGREDSGNQSSNGYGSSGRGRPARGQYGNIQPTSQQTSSPRHVSALLPPTSHFYDEFSDDSDHVTSTISSSSRNSPPAVPRSVSSPVVLPGAFPVYDNEPSRSTQLRNTQQLEAQPVGDRDLRKTQYGQAQTERNFRDSGVVVSQPQQTAAHLPTPPSTDRTSWRLSRGELPPLSDISDGLAGYNNPVTSAYSDGVSHVPYQRPQALAVPVVSSGVPEDSLRTTQGTSLPQQRALTADQLDQQALFSPPSFLTQQQQQDPSQYERDLAVPDSIHVQGEGGRDEANGAFIDRDNTLTSQNKDLHSPNLVQSNPWDGYVHSDVRPSVSEDYIDPVGADERYFPPAGYSTGSSNISAHQISPPAVPEFQVPQSSLPPVSSHLSSVPSSLASGAAPSASLIRSSPHLGRDEVPFSIGQLPSSNIQTPQEAILRNSSNSPRFSSRAPSAPSVRQSSASGSLHSDGYGNLTREIPTVSPVPPPAVPQLASVAPAPTPGLPTIERRNLGFSPPMAVPFSSQALPTPPVQQHHEHQHYYHQNGTSPHSQPPPFQASAPAPAQPAPQSVPQTVPVTVPPVQNITPQQAMGTTGWFPVSTLPATTSFVAPAASGYAILPNPPAMVQTAPNLCPVCYDPFYHHYGHHHHSGVSRSRSSSRSRSHSHSSGNDKIVVIPGGGGGTGGGSGSGTVIYPPYAPPPIFPGSYGPLLPGPAPAPVPIPSTPNYDPMEFAKEQKRLDDERRKLDEERNEYEKATMRDHHRAEMDHQAANAERIQSELRAEAMREQERLKAEAEKEREHARTEAERLKAEMMAENEKQKAETEKQRIEAEKQKEEAEKQRIEALRQKEEAERQKAEAERFQKEMKEIIARHDDKNKIIIVKNDEYKRIWEIPMSKARTWQQFQQRMLEAFPPSAFELLEMGSFEVRRAIDKVHILPSLWEDALREGTEYEIRLLHPPPPPKPAPPPPEESKKKKKRFSRRFSRPPGPKDLSFAKWFGEVDKLERPPFEQHRRILG